MKQARWALHLLLLILFAFAAGLLFLREPGFGDDFTYWSFAFDLHERGLDAWQRHSFHDLRWPVWGVCWVLQAIFGPGLISFYGEPLLYLAGGAALAFAFGRIITRSLPLAWACGIAFLFHPLLDAVCHRPMPDLSEGVWGAAAVLCWWMLVRAETRARCALWAALTGACIFIAEANRITGAFIVLVLVLCTVIIARRRFGWLLVAGATAALLWGAQAAFYHHLFGDWLHDIHANMGNAGAKGTEPPPVWYLPFRFFDTLWKGGPREPLYCLLALAGMAIAWRAWGPLRWPAAAGAPADERSSDAPRALGRVVAVWFIALFLTYSCAPQSISPWRPMLRDADRFLAALAIPMAVLAVLGLAALWQLPILRQRKWGRALAERPVWTGSAVVVLLALMSSNQVFKLGARVFFNLGFVPEMRSYMRQQPPGTRVFTHEPMRAMAFLVDSATARKFQWAAPGRILHRTPELEAMAAQADEFWYARKLVWLTTRKQLEKNALPQQPPLGSYFEAPERDWRMVRLLAKADTPDLIFYRRRTPEDPAPRILTPASPELGGRVPPLPLEWTPTGKNDATVAADVPVPETLRGQLVRLEIDAGAAQVEALTIRLRFMRGEKVEAEYLLKPYLHAQPGREFFAFQIPAASDLCQVQLKLAKNAKSVRFTGLRLVVESPEK
jgi:hypothetical protein